MKKCSRMKAEKKAIQNKQNDALLILFSSLFRLDSISLSRVSFIHKDGEKAL